MANSQSEVLTLPKLHQHVKLLAFPAATTLEVAMGNLPAGAVVQRAFVFINTIVAGVPATLDVTIGVAAGDVDRYALTADIKGDALGYNELGGPGVAITSFEIEGAAATPADTAVALFLTSTVGDLDTFTAADFHVVVHYTISASK